VKPWYRQFWPWFVIALPAAGVIASVVTLVIAIDHADAPVRDDWYRRGQRINDELALDAAAAARNISALLSVGSDGQVAVELDVAADSGPAQLQLELHHPTDAARDLRVELRGDGRGGFVGTIEVCSESLPGVAAGCETRPGVAPALVLDGNWDVSLQPSLADWRLQSRVALPAQGVRLRAGS